MNVILTSLEALILKATHESLPHPDAAALEAFCTIMKDSAEGPQLAAQALATRIHSQNAREALLALSMLDRCMRRCEITFHVEVGKFRFLNEMIKLVSPKYLADRTSPEVQTRVLQLLHAWSIEYPKETKFKVAYDMLKNQGVVKETPPPLPPEDTPLSSRQRARNAIFEDEEKSKLLQKLLQSKKPEDLQHANRLIKTMVREEERRNEANSRRALEVSAALDSAGLLLDMLEHASEASFDEQQLIHELHSNCSQMRPVLQRLATADTMNDDLSEILHANDVLVEVSKKYNEFFANKTDKSKSAQFSSVNSNDTLLDFAGLSINKNDGKLCHSNEASMSNAIDELGDIFSNESSTSNIVEPLKPVSLIQNDDVDLLGDKTNKTEGWNELDSLGEQMLKQSLPENAKRIDRFNSKQIKKIPMNAFEKASPKHDVQPTNNGTLFDLDFLIKKEENDKNVPPEPLPDKQMTGNDDVMVDITTNTITISNTITNDNLNVTNTLKDNILDLDDDVAHLDIELTSAKTVETYPVPIQRDNSKIKSGDVRPLTDINVTLQSVQPSKVSPLTVFEEDGGVTVILHFCKDKPRPDVNVIVISTTSKNSSPIEDYKFQAVLPKGCKVRLLPPSDCSLPAYNPFLPPPALTQVMLVARPAALKRLDLKFVITYTCDEDMISEMGEASNLPLDEV